MAYARVGRRPSPRYALNGVGSLLEDLRFRLRALFSRGSVERELDEELRLHLERQTAAFVATGLTEEEAARRARLEFGGVEQVKEDCRDARGTRPFEDLGQDIQLGARLLAKDRWFTVSAVAALALCLAASSTTFTMVNALTRGLPVDAPDRIVRVEARDAAGRPLKLSSRDLEEWRGANAVVRVAGFAQAQWTVGNRGSAERVSGAYLSADAFRLLGERPLLGRDFRAEDDRPGAPAVAILGGQLWHSRYGGDPAVVGRTIVINDVPTAIIGVMKTGFRFPMVADLWLPLAMMPGLTEKRDERIVDAFGRLTARATISQAQSELDTIAARVAHEFPETDGGVASTVTVYAGGGLTQPFYLALLGGVALVLLIGCANVANLLLARETRRSHETGIRLSLGARRWRVVRRPLIEGALLGGTAGILGFVLSLAAVRLIARDLEGINFPYWLRWTMDGRVFVFALTTSIICVPIFSLAPALHALKTDVTEVLTGSRRWTGGRGGIGRWNNGLLTAELAITLILLAGAGLMMRSFVALYRADLVIDASNLLTVPLQLPPGSYPTVGQRTAFWDQLEQRLRGIAGISGASTGSSMPFIGAARRELSLEGRTTGDRAPVVSFVTVGPGYFETLGLPVTRGRTFTPVDRVSRRESAIVNDRFAAMFFRDQDPIGRRIQLGSTGHQRDDEAATWLTIVGVTRSCTLPADLRPPRGRSSRLCAAARGQRCPLASRTRPAGTRVRRVDGPPGDLGARSSFGARGRRSPGRLYDAIALAEPHIHRNVRGVRVGFHGFGRSRALWGDGLCRHPTNPRDRRTNRLGCQGLAGRLTVRTSCGAAAGTGSSSRLLGCPRSGAPVAQLPGPDGSRRSCHLDRRGCVAGYGGLGCVPGASPSREPHGSCRCAPVGVARNDGDRDGERAGAQMSPGLCFLAPEFESDAAVLLLRPALQVSDEPFGALPVAVGARQGERPLRLAKGLVGPGEA